MGRYKKLRKPGGHGMLVVKAMATFPMQLASYVTHFYNRSALTIVCSQDGDISQ